MTTARQIIESAYSELGITSAGQNPASNEYDFGLERLNALQRSLFGDVIGPTLTAKPRTTAGRIENGERVMAKLAGAATFTLNPKPKAGDRFGVNDTGNNFATNNFTINPQGFLIEGGTANKVLSTSGARLEWFFRDDAGDWTLVQDWTIDQDIYFDGILDRPLTAMLARILAPSFGEAATLSQTTVQEAIEGRLLFARRYGRKGRVESPPRAKVDPGAMAA